MKEILLYVQVASAVLMVIAILMQQRSSGLSSEIAGVSAGAYTASRGIDKLLFRLTVLFALVFFGCAIWYLFV